MFEKAKLIQSDHSQPYLLLNFLNIEVILHSGNTVETDIYLKDTNEHDYLSYNNAKTIFHIILLSVLLLLFLMMKRLR